MIVFHEQEKAFLLNGKDYSYALYINGVGYLQNLHYGAKVSAGDLHAMVVHYGTDVAPKAGDFNYTMAADTMPSECGFFGQGDYHSPTVLAERTDGALFSRLCYVSHKIYKGTPDLGTLPHARKDGETLSVTLKDCFSDLLVTLNYTVWEDSNVLVRNIEICNGGKEEMRLKKAFSFCFELPESNFRLLRLQGRWAAERAPDTTPVGFGTVRLESARGASSHQTNPFMGLIGEDCNENAGECYGVQLIYSGSFALTCEKNNNASLRIQGGINDLAFGWSLKGGEKFVTPQAALCYSANGLGEMSRSYSDFLRAHVIPERFVAKSRPVVLNNWEATYFNFDEKKLFSIIDEAAALGVDVFVLDDGWFGKRNSDRAGLGDWFVNEQKLKGGLKAISEYCKSKSIGFGLWFEPEMVNEDSELFRAHPDWTIGKDGCEPCRSRNQLVLDFSRKEVVDYLFDCMSKIIADNGINYIKWDMNRNITEFFSRALSPERQGELTHRYILGVYDLASRLTEAFPDILFEGCAGGGGRFDAGMLYYFPQIWTSDDTDGYERAKIQFGTSMCYPASAMSCHVSVCPNHQTGRTVPFFTRSAIASLGAFGYELDPSALAKEEKEAIRLQIQDYKKSEQLILSGDLYRLADPFTGNYFCMMLVSKDKSSAYVVGESLRGIPSHIDRRFIRLTGLDENKQYFIPEMGSVFSGAALTRKGLVAPHLPDYGCWVWRLHQIDGEKINEGYGKGNK